MQSNKRTFLNPHFPLSLMAKNREKFKTEHGVFDQFTSRVLFKLSSENYFEGLVSPISIGKESNVFSAIKKDKSLVAVKIYRLENCDFNRMFDYIKSDPRFMGLLKKRRQVIFAWAQREFRNLHLAREANVKVPTPLAFKYNVLVEEFIGDDDGPAPRLVNMPPKDPEAFFQKILKEINHFVLNNRIAVNNKTVSRKNDKKVGKAKRGFAMG